MKRPLLIGITGNIGSGKSSFCELLESSGLRVIYADRVAEKYLFELQDVWVQRWGRGILSAGIPDKKKIAAIVFDHEEERAYLNQKVHSLVLQDFQRSVETREEAVLCFEIPLLYEVGLQDCFDYLVLISVRRDIALSRIATRDKISESEIIKRLEAQMSDEGKHADLMIDNSGNRAELEAQARSLITSIATLSYRTVRPFC
ncbi:MAG TPA: dephospho-CoA kinase [Candidatus Cloacimonadota bacterium]|nr:dephospho-CoA kinase [Candidatus Cloacimonadota bacterium]